MVVTGSTGRPAELPPAFAAALRELRDLTPRSEVLLEEVPAPQRLAPHAVALSADVVDAEDEDLGSGRLVLLHEPDGHETWDGDFRLVTYVRAELDPEMAADPLLAQVGWSWLLEVLSAHGADHRAPSGTVTRVLNESFGSLGAAPPQAEIEIRASWTPAGGTVANHVEAWIELLCTAAGLPPLPDGVAVLPRQRGPGASHPRS